MRVLIFKDKKLTVEKFEEQMKRLGYPYQLLDWQRTKESIKEAVSQFRKYGEYNSGVAVKTSSGWSIFIEYHEQARESFRFKSAVTLPGVIDGGTM